MSKAKKEKRREARRPNLHPILYTIIRPIVRLIVRLRFKFEIVNCDIEGPYLLMANHNNNWDPVLIGATLRTFPYYVASEHITRWGFISKLLNWLFRPIIRAKGTTESATAKTIIKTLRGGASVCLFAEGNRSANGETCPILPSTAKLARRCGAKIVTYRFHGGYLTAPRWAKGDRKGRLRYEIAGVYEPEQIQAMSDDEVYELIKRDLYVDAFAEQRREMIPFKGKDLAESIELGLYCCPRCKRLNTITSKGDEFGCDCGLALRYNVYGFFESLDGGEPPFETALEWDRWQQAELERVYKSWDDPQKPLFCDDGQRIYRVEFQTGATLIGHGTLSMFTDRLQFDQSGSGVVVLRFDELSDIDTVARMDIIFSTIAGDRCEIKSDIVRNAKKYVDLYRVATAAKK